MAARTRVSFGIFAVAMALGAGAIGCDAGGLILVDETEGEKPKPEAQASDMVAAGNVAKNGKYTIVHTMGQPSPQSRLKGAEKTLNGGVVGATQAN